MALSARLLCRSSEAAPVLKRCEPKTRVSADRHIAAGLSYAERAEKPRGLHFQMTRDLEGDADEHVCFPVAGLSCGFVGPWRRWCSPTSAPKSPGSSRLGAMPVSPQCPLHSCLGGNVKRELSRSDLSENVRRRSAAAPSRAPGPTRRLRVEDQPGRRGRVGAPRRPLDIKPALVGFPITASETPVLWAHVAAARRFSSPAKRGHLPAPSGWERGWQATHLSIVP